ncbi:VWA domain-containing protein [archaeon]|nr:VWA domain-containing protein [archaeon]
MNKETVREIFAQVRSELYFPPCELEIVEKQEKDSAMPFYVLNTKVYISLNSIPNNVNEEKYLRSVIRHEVSHLHYCPYDLRTAHELLKSAYNACRDWNLAYFSLLLFSDLNVDCFYLTKRFGEVPYHAEEFISSRQSGINEYIQATYEQLLDKRKKGHKYTIETVARQIKIVMRSEKNWFSKVRLISKILAKYNVKVKVPRNKVGASSGYIPLREDLSKNTLEEALRAFGGIRERNEAKAFYTYWIEPRLKNSEIEKLKEELKKGKGKGEEKAGVHKGKGKESDKMLKPSFGTGKEPVLPTSLGKPYSSIPENLVEDIVWRMLWYIARAKRAMLIYLEEGRRPEPSLSVSKYPVDWNVEDDVEDLDLEASLDEGKIRIEVNTIKWESEAKEKGNNLTIGRIPSSIIVLDSSKSMEKIFDDAATSAFISLLTSERIGSNAAVINFSTNYYTREWENSLLEKEMALAINFNDMTILPLNEILKLVEKSQNNVLINIITDCGWQNIEEVLPSLKEIVERGHKITIFYLRGGEYIENLEKINKINRIKIIPVREPERDLQNIVIRETAKEYGKELINLK